MRKKNIILPTIGYIIVTMAYLMIWGDIFHTYLGTTKEIAVMLSFAILGVTIYSIKQIQEIRDTLKVEK